MLSGENSSLGTTKKLNLDFQNSLGQTNYHLPHPSSPSLPPVMCYPAPSQFWALPQPELKHKSEENYPDSKNKFFCRSFFFSSCGQYCSWPCNPIPSLQLTIWWAYFSSVTQQKPLLFFFLDETSTGLVTWISSSRAREEQRRGEKKREGGGKQDILILAYKHTPNIELTTELSTQI